MNYRLCHLKTNMGRTRVFLSIIVGGGGGGRFADFISFLAHLSQRLMVELIVNQSLRRPSVVRPQFQTSSLKPLDKFKFHMETPKDVGMKVCSNGPGHMTKMAATPIYGKNPSKIFFSRTRRPMTLRLGM